MKTSKRRTPVRVREVLVSALPELGDRLMEETIRSEWSRLVGTGLGRRSRPERLKGGVLEVIVDNSPCLQELTLRSREVLTAVQARFAPVAALRFTLGMLPAHAPARAQAGRPRAQSRLSPEDLHVVEAMATTLPDPILAGGLRRLLTKDLLARRQRDADQRRGHAFRAEKESS